MLVLPARHDHLHCGQREQYEDFQDALSSSLSSLKAPQVFSQVELAEAEEKLSKYAISFEERGEPHLVALTTWFRMVEALELPKSFISALTKLSAQPSCAAPIENLKLGNFCEVRAAYAATQLSLPTQVFLSQQNSAADSRGADLTIVLPEVEKSIDIQVKATEGKESRLRANIPTLKNVKSLNLVELRQRIEEICSSVTRR